MHDQTSRCAPDEAEPLPELRLFGEKRQRIKAGENLTKTVEKLHRFDSFDELYRTLHLLKCGYTEEDVAQASPADMERYFSMEDQKHFGVVGIELEHL